MEQAAEGRRAWEAGLLQPIRLPGTEVSGVEVSRRCVPYSILFDRFFGGQHQNLLPTLIFEAY